MDEYSHIIAQLLNRDSVSAPQITSIVTNLNDYQYGIIAYLLLDSNTESNIALANTLIAERSELRLFLPPLFPQISSCLQANNCKDNQMMVNVLLKLQMNEPIGLELFSSVMSSIMDGKASKYFVGLFLIIIYTKGIGDDDLHHLTISMLHTGKVFDYRNDFPGNKVIRRYPTGALSEKVALLLPSLLSIAAKDYPLISPFTVAKSLSFTGGTWSKLSVINGFDFPKPGLDTIKLLRKCSVALTVAQNDLCPVDTLLYQIRGFTGTVDSIPLAAASIASKQLACPADLLLLDVRYGEGAFFDEMFAQKLLEKIEVIFEKNGLSLISTMTETLQPTGSGVGNHIELCEAIAIMKNEIGPFDKRSLDEQKDIVISFFGKLMNYYFPDFSEQERVSYCERLFIDGRLLLAFRDLCIAHGMSTNDVSNLLDSPFSYLNLRKIGGIYSDCDGVLKSINQKQLGNISNFCFATQVDIDANANDCLDLLLHKRLFDKVKKGEIICSVFSVNDYQLTGEQISRIQSCFTIC